jgi:hypothetical protein
VRGKKPSKINPFDGSLAAHRLGQNVVSLRSL